jgi:hypothetical protein
MPQDYLDFDAALKNKIKSVLKPSYDGWKDILSNYEGFIDNTGDKYDEIENLVSSRMLLILSRPDLKSFVCLSLILVHRAPFETHGSQPFLHICRNVLLCQTLNNIYKKVLR